MTDKKEAGIKISRERIEAVLDALTELRWSELQEVAKLLIVYFNARSSTLPGGTRLAQFRPDEICHDLLHSVVDLCHSTEKSRSK